MRSPFLCNAHARSIIAYVLQSVRKFFSGRRPGCAAKPVNKIDIIVCWPASAVKLYLFGNTKYICFFGAVRHSRWRIRKSDTSLLFGDVSELVLVDCSRVGLYVSLLACICSKYLPYNQQRYSLDTPGFIGHHRCTLPAGTKLDNSWE